ncbi:MAG: hypothetical protein QOE33_852 [Acidobacteriota bacterium]|nr:hypothetical protein [Acidobacteriota bacterium]
MRCVACGSECLVEGVVTPMDSSNGVLFIPTYISKFKAMLGVFKAMLGGDVREVRAYGCVSCGHLQHAVTFSEEERQHFLKFEGQQPDVLERLSEEPEAEGQDNG